LTKAANTTEIGRYTKRSKNSTVKTPFGQNLFKDQKIKKMKGQAGEKN
jgi:hypothetical protein